MSRRRRVRRYARPECTIETLQSCIAKERECRACPPLPPEGLAPWLHRIGFYKWTPRVVREPRNADARFMESVKKLKNGCWLWTGKLNARGMPRFFYDHAQRIAHRWAYERWRGELPRMRHTLHTCGNRRCVNPMHVEIQRA
jgi:hypothetical protein